MSKKYAEKTPSDLPELQICTVAGALSFLQTLVSVSFTVYMTFSLSLLREGCVGLWHPNFFPQMLVGRKVYSGYFPTKCRKTISLATSVKLSEADKRKLERLHALVTVKTSKKVTQQEILSKLISKATEEGDRFVDETFESTVPMSDEGYRRILTLVSDWGIRTKWQDIDETVYGGTSPERF